MGLELIVYGDFNCPFSALASARAGRLERLGRASVDWRAVEHAPDIALAGSDVAGESRIALERELDQIRGLLIEGESDRLTLPTVQPNTNLATAAYASAPAAERPTIRARLFAAHWIDGADLADSDTLARLGVPRTDRSTAARWRDDWLALGESVVPVMVLPDGDVSRGLGALARLAQFEQAPTGADLGGEAPCFAHLFDENFD